MIYLFGVGDGTFSHGIVEAAQHFGIDAMFQETGPVNTNPVAPLAQATITITKFTAVAVRDDRHFFPPLEVIGADRKSPYQRTFGPVISIVPKMTGTGLPCSATGMSKSSRAAGFGFGGFGASAALTKYETTRRMICTQNVISWPQ